MEKSIFIFSMLSILIFSSCNLSVKGKWSEADKQLFRKEMSGLQSTSILGDDKSKWIECYLSKCEANYSCYNDANSDHDGGCEKLAMACTKEVLFNGSEKGKWSEADKKKFRSDMNELEGLSILGDNKSKWIECYLSKCEAHYSSYNEAYKNAENCRKIALECNLEFE